MSTSTIIPKNKPYDFLNWLYFRLKNKHSEDSVVLDRLADIIHNYKLVNSSVDINTVDKLCKNIYPHFELDSGFGLEDEDKNRLRLLVISTIEYIGANFLVQQNEEEEEPNEKDFEFELMGQQS